LDRLNLKIIIVSFSMIFSFTFTWGQNNISLNDGKKLDINTSEKVFLTLNSKTFLTGEKLLYTLHCLNSKDFSQSKISKIAYVEILDSEKKVIIKQKLFLKNSTASGEFFIPTSLKTANYVIIAYTNWMLNQDVSLLFNETISIINPYEKIENNEILKNDSVIKKVDFISNSELSLNLNKIQFSNRELVTLKLKSISNNLEKGNYTLSVRKLDSLNFNSRKKISLDNNLEKVNEIKILPELRGENISGSITSKSKSDINNIIVALSIPGENFIVKTVKTNNEGKFLFYLDKKNYNSNISIQVFDEYKEDFVIKINKPETPDYSKIPSPEKLYISSDLKRIIEQKSIANQIDNAYFNQKKDTVFKIQNQKEFYDPIAKDFILDDYTRFPTTEETITEVIKEMYYRKSKNKYTIGLRDYNINNETSQPALVMIDGLIIQDLNELFEYKMSNIYKISLFAGGYYYGSSLFNGLINFVTKEKNFESKLSGDFIIKPQIERPFPEIFYHKIDYSKNNKLDRIPDYRYQLLWEPNFDLEKEISFYTSDVSGKFEITIEGFSESGKQISFFDFFEVK
jgi:hypothetical protein